MPITKLPGVYYKEKVTYELTGEGSKIPVFIGKTGNTETGNYKVDGTNILKFSNKIDALKPVTGTDVTNNGNVQKWNTITGIGPVSDENVLAKVINEFYDEAKLTQSSDIGVPYIYVVDIGDGTNYEAWNTALREVKALYDAPVEIYVGLDKCTSKKVYNPDGTVKKDTEGNPVTEPVTFSQLIISACDAISEATEELNLRYGFTYKSNATDDELKQLTTNLINQYPSDDIQRLSRIGLVVEELFGKTIARICCTPNNTEPGYYAYRSISPDTFTRRVKEDALALQQNGIIFNRDEYINGNKYPKLNLCVSVAFANSLNRPADSLFHARFNADDLLREVFEACYSQVKANESETNIAYLQTRINKIVNDRVAAEEMVKFNDRTEEGTRLIVNPSDNDPYSLIVTGQIQPVKCTIAIEVEATVKL